MTDDLRPDPNSQYGRTPPPSPAMPSVTESPASETSPIETDSNARTMGMLCHLLSLVMFLGIPGFIGPLVIWLVKRNEHPFIDRCGKEALNFQISVLIYMFISFLLFFLIIGMFMMLAVILLSIIYAIVAAVKAGEGKDYRYPFTIRLIQ